MIPVFQAPPAAYQSPAQTVVVSFLSQDDVDRACRPLMIVGSGVRLMGCARNAPAACVVTIPTPHDWRGTGDAYLQLIAHELGHCAGWPADHPSTEAPRSAPRPTTPGRW